jgi:hypothetical protein
MFVFVADPRSINFSQRDKKNVAIILKRVRSDDDVWQSFAKHYYSYAYSYAASAFVSRLAQRTISIHLDQVLISLICCLKNRLQLLLYFYEHRFLIQKHKSACKI